MEQNTVSSEPSASSSAEAVSPAPAAEDQKPGATPASVADDQKPESAAETPEQVAAKQESRRARQNARRQQALADARAEAKFFRERAEKLESSQKAPQPGSDEPKRENYGEGEYEKYLRDLARWEAKQVSAETAKTERRDSEQRDRLDKESKVQAELARNWTEREAEYRKGNKDYDKIVEPFVEEDLQDLHQSARTAIVESESGPALLVHLATHPEAVDRIAALSPTRQAAEIGKLETQLTKSVKPSNAPPPTTPIAQGRAGQSDPNKMSDAEYKAYRKAQGARWAQ